ncbi:MAG: universal stress protein [Myxococcales bacterium]|nr:universal stress protein [Myxococcales bacterium]MCB9549618.1 universal stress protein [Myxococcales bacterium]
MSESCIVLATDLSAHAAPAARWAARVGAALGARVVVAHVIEISLKSWLASRYDILADDEKRGRAEARVSEWYREATGSAPDAVDLRVNTCFNGLSEAVQAHGASLLVMAPTGKSTLAQIVVGSRVQDIASRPPCALVVAASDHLPARIGAATDFSPGSAVAMARAGELARATGAGLVALHVAEVPDLPAFEEDLFADSFETFYAEARETLGKTAGEAFGDGVVAEQEVLHGRAELALDEYARGRGLDLLVLGQTGHDSVLGDMLGSVPRSLIGRLPCSILVVPVERT